MTENVCKNCGAPLEVAAAVNGVVTCSFCGSVFTLPKADASDKVRKHLDAGETALDQCRFDDAFASYGKAIEADKTEPEAYWGRALARNKVQYLKDTVNNRLQPICHEITDEAFTSDPDYNKALSLATPEQKAEYAKKAEEIDYIRKEFAALTKSGLTYDSFICVKVTEDGGGHTEDSFAALKLYNALKRAGYKPFFSEEEMGERTGADYEALILYALYTAPSLLIVCSDKKYLETKWVKNEYTRFAAMLADEEKERDSMTIVYRGKPIEKLPGVKGKIQGVDFAGFDAIERIKWFIDRHDAGKRAAEEDAAKAAAEGVVAGDVIIYAKFDPSNEAEAVDLFIWDESKGDKVSFGNDITFPMSLEFFADKMIKDADPSITGTPISATSSAEPDIGAIFGYVETFMHYLEPLFSSFSASAEDMTFTIKYASLINNVVMPVIAELAKIESLNFKTEWVDAHLQPLLAAIFGTYVPAGEGTEAVITPAEDVVFTLESFEYAGTTIYSKAA